MAKVQVAPPCTHLLVREVRDVEAHFLNICLSWSKAARLFLSSTLLRSRRQIHHLLFVYRSIMFLLFVFPHIYFYLYMWVFLVRPACGKRGYIYAFIIYIGNWCLYWNDASEIVMELALIFSWSLWCVTENTYLCLKMLKTYTHIHISCIHLFPSFSFPFNFSWIFSLSLFFHPASSFFSFSISFYHFLFLSIHLSLVLSFILSFFLSLFHCFSI